MYVKEGHIAHSTTQLSSDGFKDCSVIIASNPEQAFFAHAFPSRIKSKNLITVVNVYDALIEKITRRKLNRCDFTLTLNPGSTLDAYLLTEEAKKRLTIGYLSTFMMNADPNNVLTEREARYVISEQCLYLKNTQGDKEKYQYAWD